ncbi:hypothetical protein ACOMHN_029510 [Nucella lapillus]
MGNYLPSAYIYVNAGVVVCGVWAVALPQSPDAVFMTLAALLFSVLEDIILLALYEPRGYNAYEGKNVPGSLRHEYRFAIGMAVINLILKPFSAVLLYRILKASNSEDGDFTIPGIDRLPGMGSVGEGRGGVGAHCLKARNNEDSDFTIPGIDRLPGMGGGNRGGYSDIDHTPDSAGDSSSAPQGNADKEGP